MREEASFRMFFGKVRASKQELDIDDPKLPKKRKVIIRKEKYLQLRNTTKKAILRRQI